MSETVNRQVLLKSRPVGIPQAEHFEIVERAVAEPGPGQVRVRNLLLSVEPAMRGWVNAIGNYTKPVGVGEVGRGGAGRFVKVTLRPQVTVAPGTDLAAAEAIHHRIHEVCFIARSVNFPVDYAPAFVVSS